MIRGKRIFITGGAGFIANIIIKELVHDNQITILDNFARDTISGSPFFHHPNLRVIKGSVLDYGLLNQSMAGSDIVVHAAAIAGIDTVIKSATATMRVNMIGTANTLEAALFHGVSDRFINFSTSEVLGSLAFKRDEKADSVIGSAGEARWTYAVSKLASEHLSHAYFSEFGLPVVNIRPFNVYGPGQTGEGAIQKFITAAVQDEDIYIYGDGNQIRAWCFVDDFVDGLLRCLENRAAIGQSFNIGNSRTVLTTYSLAQTVCRVVDSKSKIIFKPALSADIELRIPSVTKAKEILGFEAKVDLDEGIHRTAEYLKSRLNKVLVTAL